MKLKPLTLVVWLAEAARSSLVAVVGSTLCACGCGCHVNLLSCSIAATSEAVVQDMSMILTRKKWEQLDPPQRTLY